MSFLGNIKASLLNSHEITMKMFTDPKYTPKVGEPFALVGFGTGAVTHCFVNMVGNARFLARPQRAVFMGGIFYIGFQWISFLSKYVASDEYKKSYQERNPVFNTTMRDSDYLTGH